MLFEHADDPTRELCRIEQHGRRVIVHHHRAGEPGRVESFDGADLDAAGAEYDRQIVAVYERGYRIVRDWVDPPLAHAPQLEAMIAEDPDDETRWQVLADWVLGCDDVRANIVRFEQTRRSRDPAETWGQYATELFGDERAAELLTEPMSRGEWHAGHVRRCRIACDPEVIAAFVAAPSTRLVRELELETMDQEMLHAALRALAGAPCRRTLRRLHLIIGGRVLDVATLFPLLAREAAPALTTLGLTMHGDQDADAVFSALADSALLPQLRALEVVRGALAQARGYLALAPIVRPQERQK